MAESILDSLWALLQPRAAEAKITGGPDEMAMLAQLEAANQQQPGQYLPAMRQLIINRAKAHPKTVTLLGVPASERGPRGPGEYEGWSQEVTYNKDLPQADLANVVPHELLHFLSAESARPMGQAAEHALMSTVLGAPPYTSAAALEGYQPQRALSPVEHEVLRAWFGGGGFGTGGRSASARPRPRSTGGRR